MSVETPTRKEFIVQEPKRFVAPIIETKRKEHIAQRALLLELKDHFSSTEPGSTYDRELTDINHLIDLDNQ